MKIDRDERAGWGFVTEFYVAPSKRKLGWDCKLFTLVAKVLQARDAKNIWLTTTPTAEQFWTSLGFKETGDVDSRNNQKIMAISIWNDACTCASLPSPF